jgi:hypothetical protein
MSYKLGYAAFLRRFEKRFEVGKFNWEIDEDSTKDDISIKIFSGKEKIVQIHARLAFGIKIFIQSPYLTQPKNSWSMHRRPRRVVFANQHNMRMWLRDKPKFGRLGAKYASQIFNNFQAQCL